MAGGFTSNDALEIVPLGGVGEFGMNMMAVSCGETTIVIDAGVMFPGPDLLGVDLIVPDLTYLQDRHVAALVLTHGHEDHIGGVPYVLAAARRAGVRHAADARAGRAQTRRARHRSRRSSASPCAGRSRRHRLDHGGVPARHSQHSRLRGAGVAHAGRHAGAHGRLQGRSDAARRPARGPASVRDARVGGRARAARRQHEHRPARVHRIGDRRHRRVRGDLHVSDRQCSWSRRFRRACSACRSSCGWPRGSGARSRLSVAG